MPRRNRNVRDRNTRRPDTKRTQQPTSGGSQQYVTGWRKERLEQGHRDLQCPSVYRRDAAQNHYE